MRNFITDVRHWCRVLAKNPGFAVITIAALALGIGANAAIFSVIERVLLRPLPFFESERIMEVHRHFPGGDGRSISIPKYMAWRKCAAFQSIAMYDFGSHTLNLGTGDRPDPVNGMRASAGFFDVFAVKPILGRTYSPQEDLPNAGHFAVITYKMWKDHLAGDPNIAGRAIILNREPFTVLGVLPENYQPEPPTDLYIPGQFDPESTNQGHIYNVAGRLRPGATEASATAELKVIGDQFRASHADIMDPNESVGVTPLRDAIGGDVRPALLILAGAVAFVLLIACANVANLLLARAAGRSREIALRTAIGAGRGRLIQQLLTESLVLAFAGGVAGLFVAQIGVKLLLAFSPGNIPRINDPDHAAAALSLLDWRALVFLFAISVLTGVIFGLLPALRVSKLDVNSALKESSGRSGTGLKSNRIRGALVVAEIALAMILLAGAALMIRTFQGLRSVKPGFDTANVLTIKTSTSGSHYASTERVETMIRTARERIEALPGVESAAATLTLPMDGNNIDLPFSIVGREPKMNGKWEGDDQWRFVSAHYFEVLRIPLQRGRYFDARDSGKASRVVIVNEAFAKKYWPGGDPLGQQMLIGHGLGPDFEEGAREIVGVVGSITDVGLSQGVVPVMYVPEGQITDGMTKLADGLLPLSWVIRTKTDPLLAGQAVKREFDSLDPELSPSKLRSMEQVISDSTQRENFNTLLLTVFASIALLLAAIGIYGLMSYSVEQRTQEIGIRMALGANAGTMMAQVLREGMLLAGLGIVIGGAAAVGLTRSLASLLFNIKSNDPWTYAAVAVILALVSMAAALVPARRATMVDPILALRHE